MEIPCINKVILSILSYLIRKPIPINFIVGGGGGGGGASGILYQNTISAITSLLYIANVMSEKTQSFPKPLKKLRQLGV